MKKILVPTDLSRSSFNTVELACDIAKRKGMTVRILHVIEDYHSGSFSAMGNINGAVSLDHVYVLKMMSRAKGRIKKLKSHVSSFQVPVEESVVVGTLPNGIINEIESQDIDLVIMTHNPVENDGWFNFGGNTKEVIRYSPAPVLTVSENISSLSVRKMVFASDFEDSVVDQIIKRVKDLSQILNSELGFVKMTKPKNLSKELMYEQLRDISAKYDLQDYVLEYYSDEKQEAGIRKYARKINADMIVVCTHGRTGLAHLFKGSVAEDLAMHAQVPVLTYNINPRFVKKAATPVADSSRK